MQIINFHLLCPNETALVGKENGKKARDLISLDETKPILLIFRDPIITINPSFWRGFFKRNFSPSQIGSDLVILGSDHIHSKIHSILTNSHLRNF